MGGRLYTYHWGRGRWEGDCIPIAGEEGDGREIVYLSLEKREMGGRLYTYRWRRGRWEGDCIPITGEEGDRREIVYLSLGKKEIGGRLYTYCWGRGRLYTYRYTVITRMTVVLRWTAMRAILMFH